MRKIRTKLWFLMLVCAFLLSTCAVDAKAALKSKASITYSFTNPTFNPWNDRHGNVYVKGKTKLKITMKVLGCKGTAKNICYDTYEDGEYTDYCVKNMFEYYNHTSGKSGCLFNKISGKNLKKGKTFTTYLTTSDRITVMLNKPAGLKNLKVKVTFSVVGKKKRIKKVDKLFFY